jgi:hypothetical protein
MYYSYIEIEYVATSFSPARIDLAVELLRLPVAKTKVPKQKRPRKWRVGLKIFGWML